MTYEGVRKPDRQHPEGCFCDECNPGFHPAACLCDGFAKNQPAGVSQDSFACGGTVLVWPAALKKMFLETKRRVVSVTRMHDEQFIVTEEIQQGETR